jgi:hypothetical protein
MLRIALAVALLMVSNLAFPQMYSWKDPTNGASRFSNIAPPWYSSGETVRGPQVIVTVGRTIVDDTALPYEERLLLSGKSKEYIEKLRLQKLRDPRAPQSTIRESRTRSDTETVKRPSADSVSSGGDGRKGS